MVITFGLGLTSYLVMPLRPPHVALQFQGFKPDRTRIMALTSVSYGDNGEVRFTAPADGMSVYVGEAKDFPLSQTNSLAIICMTNHGPTRIWWTAWMDCRVEARTPNGWVTNQAMYLTWLPYSVASPSTDTFGVWVPNDAIEWRVHGWYGFYERHNARKEFIEWLFDDLGFGMKSPGDPPKSNWLRYAVLYPLMLLGSATLLLPEPQEQIGVVTSALFTNIPPMDLPHF